MPKLNDGSIEGVLEKVEQQIGGDLSNPARYPQSYVRDVYSRWRDAGGLVSGKIRHSERFLDDALRKRGIRLRSLNPKLGATARTNLSPMDGKALIEYFMEQWPVLNENGDNVTAYRAILEPTENSSAGFICCRSDNPNSRSVSGGRWRRKQIDAR